jgi:hypothetical protein
MRLAARVTAGVLTAAGATLLAWSGLIHIRLWYEGYETIPTIGPLFLAQGVASLLIAVALVLLRRLVLLAAGAATLAASAAGLLLSAHTGLFGYRESLAVPYAGQSLVIEFTGAAVLLLAGGTTLALARHGSGAGLFRRHGRGSG